MAETAVLNVNFTLADYGRDWHPLYNTGICILIYGVELALVGSHRCLVRDKLFCFYSQKFFQIFFFRFFFSVFCILQPTFILRCFQFFLTIQMFLFPPSNYHLHKNVLFILICTRLNFICLLNCI